MHLLMLLLPPLLLLSLKHAQALQVTVNSG